MPEFPETPVYKIALSGACRSGKSLFLAYLLSEDLSSKTYSKTIGAEFRSTKYNGNHFKIWDTGGGEDYRNANNPFITQVHLIAFVIHEKTSQEELEHIKRTYADHVASKKNPPLIRLIINQSNDTQNPEEAINPDRNYLPQTITYLGLTDKTLIYFDEKNETAREEIKSRLFSSMTMNEDHHLPINANTWLSRFKQIGSSSLSHKISATFYFFRKIVGLKNRHQSPEEPEKRSIFFNLLNTISQLIRIVIVVIIMIALIMPIILFDQLFKLYVSKFSSKTDEIAQKPFDNKLLPPQPSTAKPPSPSAKRNLMTAFNDAARQKKDGDEANDLSATKESSPSSSLDPSVRI